ncbi:MAG: glycosyltransferase [Bacteroidales bacterium]
MNIAFLTQGTRGDIEPFIVLGKALVQRGHIVTISAPRNFDQLINQSGLKFSPIEIDVQELLNSNDGKELLKGNPFTIFKLLKSFIYPYIESSLELYLSLTRLNDIVIYHPKTLCDCFAHQFPNKMIRSMPIPAVERTHEFASPALSGFKLFSFIPSLSYFVLKLGSIMMSKPINCFLKRNSISKNNKYVELPFLYPISEQILKKPADYPTSSHFTGFWNSISEDPLPGDVLEFLNHPTPPIIVTFGSMTDKKMESKLELIIDKLLKMGQRVIVVSGWSKVDIAYESSDLLNIKNIPYDTLFPRAKAVIHHGGIGTTAACLIAGIPMLVLPIMYPVGDQMFWGKLAHSKGVSPKPIPYKRIDSSKLELSLSDLINNQEYYKNSKRFSQLLKRESGLNAAIKIIEDRLN